MEEQLIFASLSRHINKFFTAKPFVMDRLNYVIKYKINQVLGLDIENGRQSRLIHKYFDLYLVRVDDLEYENIEVQSIDVFIQNRYSIIILLPGSFVNGQWADSIDNTARILNKIYNMLLDIIKLNVLPYGTIYKLCENGSNEVLTAHTLNYLIPNFNIKQDVTVLNNIDSLQATLEYDIEGLLDESMYLRLIYGDR